MRLKDRPICGSCDKRMEFLHYELENGDVYNAMQKTWSTKEQVIKVFQCQTVGCKCYSDIYKTR